jgi:hypothetical protein
MNLYLRMEVKNRRRMGLAEAQTGRCWVVGAA